MGVAWAHSQMFTDAQKDEVRAVAQLAADALRRARVLEAERAARHRTERLQQTMTALVASASLTEVTAAVFEHAQHRERGRFVRREDTLNVVAKAVQKILRGGLRRVSRRACELIRRDHLDTGILRFHRLHKTSLALFGAG